MAKSMYCVINYHSGEFERIQEIETPESLIGRSDASSIWLPDPLVSRQHAMLCWSGDVASIRDLGSRNGTRVNGGLICEQEILCSAARVQIGPYILRISLSLGAALRMARDPGTSSDGSSKRHRQTELSDIELTPAQRIVCDGLTAGLTERELAASLKIETHDVRKISQAVYRAHTSTSKEELIRRWAMQQSRRMAAAR